MAMKFFLLAAFLAVAAATQAGTDSDLWRKFKLEHKKSYSKLEEVHRFNVFQQNLRRIEEHNKLYEAGQSTYTLGVNQFADLTQEEFGQLLRKFQKPTFNSTIPRTKFVKIEGLEVPYAVDYRQMNAVTAVKDQEDCGACWAFATTGALEGAFALKNKKLVSFSEQQLVDCTTGKEYGMAGCNGGEFDPAFQYMHDHGMLSEADYPYEGKDGTCRYSSLNVVRGSRVASYVDVEESDEEALHQAVGTVGPVSVAIYGEAIFLYDSGIFNNVTCQNYDVDHGVLAVGYGSQNGVDYWIVKNSWGPSWGENGYIRMKRGVNMCNIALQPSYPVV